MVRRGKEKSTFGQHNLSACTHGKIIGEELNVTWVSLSAFRKPKELHLEHTEDEMFHPVSVAFRIYGSFPVEDVRR